MGRLVVWVLSYNDDDVRNVDNLLHDNFHVKGKYGKQKATRNETMKKLKEC